MNKEKLPKKLEKVAERVKTVRKIDEKRFKKAKETLLKSLKLGGKHGWHGVEIELQGIKVFEKTF